MFMYKIIPCLVLSLDLRKSEKFVKEKLYVQVSKAHIHGQLTLRRHTS